MTRLSQHFGWICANTCSDELAAGADVEGEPKVGTPCWEAVSGHIKLNFVANRVDILIKRNGQNVMGIDLKIGAGFPGKKRREISRRAGNIPIVQIFIGVKGR